MPSLTAQRLAERDREVRASGRDRSQFSRMMGRGDEIAAERADLARDRFEAQQAQRSVSNTFKEAELAMKAEAAAQRATAAETATSLRDKQIEIQAKTQELRDLEAARKADRTAEILTQATNFLRDARGMNPSKDEFDAQLQEMLAGYPDALEHPAVAKWFSYNTEQREKQRVRSTALAATSGMRPTKVTADGVTYETPAPPDNGTIRQTTDDEGKVSTTVTRAVQPILPQDYGGAGTAPAATAPAAPTLTSKAEFDALPAGAEYIRDGRRYRKP